LREKIKEIKMITNEREMFSLEPGVNGDEVRVDWHLRTDVQPQNIFNIPALERAVDGVNDEGVEYTATAVFVADGNFDYRFVSVRNVKCELLEGVS
jgi:hypothetical protein